MKLAVMSVIFGGLFFSGFSFADQWVVTCVDREQNSEVFFAKTEREANEVAKEKESGAFQCTIGFLD